MAEPTPIQDFSGGNRIVGTCAKCGRDFVAMPINRRDNYPPRRDRHRRPVAEPNEDGECGGIVLAAKPE